MVEVKLDVPESQEKVNLVSNENFVNSILGDDLKKVHGLTGGSVLSTQGSTLAISPLLQAAHTAFSDHHSLSLRPEVLWYCISYEVAKHVRLNPDKYKKLFNGNPNKKKVIRAEDDSLTYGVGMEGWLPAIGLYRPLLAEHIPEETQQMFLPEYSTTTYISNAALLLSFMDAASPYYDYRMRTLCGIPRVKLEGDKEDWDLLVSRTQELSRAFVGLSEYFSNLIPVLQEVTSAFDGNTNEEFWMSLYKRGGGSGGPYVQGWITSLVAHVGDRSRNHFDWRRSFGSFGGLNVGDFPPHLSQIDFIWEYLGSEIPMSFVSGVLDVSVKDGYLTPELGVGVVERHA